MNEGIPLWLFVFSLALFGLALGSFAGAQVWRLRARQLIDDKASGEAYDKQELRQLKPLAEVTTKNDRSQCLNCHHTLAWFDLLPLVSWLSTGGRCRYCHKSIGRFEPVIEFGLAVFFVASYFLWPLPLETGLDITLLALWLMAGVPLAILFAYDAKWFLLPDTPMLAFLVLASGYAGLSLYVDGVTIESLLSLLGAMAAIGGLYGLLYAVSRGRWVGYGDVTLGAGLGLMLVRWELALVAVVLANFVGTVLVLPGLLRGTLERTSQLPFGPLLIIGMALAHFFGQAIIDWYLSIL